MPFQRPTLKQLIDRTEAEFATRLGLGALMDRGVLRPLARLVAGASHLQHGHLDWSSRQLIIDRAEAEELEEWAAVWAITRKPAAQATGLVTFTGSGAASIPQGTPVKRPDGVQYATDVPAVLVAGVATVAVTSVLGGSEANASIGTTLSLVTPLPGLVTEATVASNAGLGIVNGTDVENDEDLLARLLQRVQNPPMGGADADYVRWALEVAGVTRAWTKPLWLGAGTVGVTFVVDGDPNGNIIPDATKVAEVQAYISDRSRRPVTAAVTVFAPTPKNLNPQIQLVPNIADVQATVTTAIDALLRREASPGATLLISHLREAISTAAGETNHVLLFPTSDLVQLPYELLVRGTITFS